jgi:hypothetical protein
MYVCIDFYISAVSMDIDNSVTWDPEQTNLQGIQRWYVVTGSS